MPNLFQVFEDIHIGGLTLAKLLSAVLILIICCIVIRILGSILKKAMEKSKMEKGLKNFVMSAVRIALWVLAIIIVAESLGIPTTSLVAVVSIAGLALSLSVQNIMANLFSGVTVLATKPFVSGDFVELGGVSGTVEAVGLFHTTILTVDNKRVYVPNSEVTASKVFNYSHEPLRRVDIAFSVSYDTTIDQVRAALSELANLDARILKDPEPFVGVNAYKASTIEYTLRAWTNSADYWDVYFLLTENLLPALKNNGGAMSYEHMNVHVVDIQK